MELYQISCYLSMVCTGVALKGRIGSVLYLGLSPHKLGPYLSALLDKASVPTESDL